MFRCAFYGLTIIYFIILAFVFYGRVVIAIPAQAASCLNSTIFLVNFERQPKVERGEIVAFSFVGETPVLKTGDKVLKLVAAIPGDVVKVTEHALYINNVKHPKAKSMSKNLNTLGHPASKYAREVVLKDREYFVIGETADSYDSRFWGTIKHEQITGKAYAVF